MANYYGDQHLRLSGRLGDEERVDNGLVKGFLLPSLTIFQARYSDAKHAELKLREQLYCILHCDACMRCICEPTMFI